MIDIDRWMEGFREALAETFGERVWFLGLQGSRARGEARETSDIDVVVVLDELGAEDVAAYRAMLDGLERRKLVCGFLSGKDELLSWDAADLFQFYHDTRPIIGSLDGLLPLLDEEAVARAAKVGACNVYHGCAHNMVHERSADMLAELLKGASFAIRANAFLRAGEHLRGLAELRASATDRERAVIDALSELRTTGSCEFDRTSALLFDWAKAAVTERL